MSIVVSVVNVLQLRWRWLVFFHGIRETNGKAWSVYWNRGAGVPLWAVGSVGFSWRRWWGHQRRELARALVRWLAEDDDGNDSVEDIRRCGGAGEDQELVGGADWGLSPAPDAADEG